MNRRRLLVFGVPFAFVVLGVGGWLVSSGSPINRANVSKIKNGMTLAEVEVILGGPERCEMGGGGPWRVVPPHSLPPVLHFHQWASNEIRVRVYIDHENRVADCRIDLERDRTLSGMLRRWLRL
jgi:hypothetical protein